MFLTGRALEWTLVCSTVGVPLLAILPWTRVGGPRWPRASQRLSLVALSEAVAVRDHFGASEEFLALSRPPTRPFSVVAVHAAHNLKVLALSEVLVWIAKHLSAPAAPVTA